VYVGGRGREGRVVSFVGAGGGGGGVGVDKLSTSSITESK